ncbi:caspase family protein [Actinomadura sp. 3N508]|uniref:HD domain-containing protein n=1 Tax=Actinomadura sp. 3N508 TaxID=3375153 RepID=UPI00378D6792
MAVTRQAHLIGVPWGRYSGLDDITAAVTADVHRMEEALRQSEYTVETWGLDGGQRTTRNLLKKIIKDACDNAPEEGVLLLYFTGHGVSIDGRDYLVPSDATRHGEQGPLDVDSLVPVMPVDLTDCPAKLVVYFVDACREPVQRDDGIPFGGFGQTLPAFPSDGHFVLITGCAAGQVCNYNESGSTFTQALAEVLDHRHTARTLSEVFDEVKRRMAHQARWVSQPDQQPAVGHRLMLVSAGDQVVCDGDELAAAWQKSVVGSRLWDLCRDRAKAKAALDCARDIIDACAQRYGNAKDTLLRHTGLADLWTDQNYPSRVLACVETLLGDEAELKPAEAAMLATAPFLREAVLSEGIREAAGTHPENLERTYRPGPRTDLEGIHEMHQHIVRRIEGFEKRGRKRERDLLVTWLMHQWLGTRRSVWRTPAATEAYALGASLIADAPGAAGARELALLAEALVRAVGGEPVDSQLHKKLNDAYVSKRWRGMGAVLWLAGTLAADVRRTRSVLADLVGTRMELPPQDVQNAAGRDAVWTLAAERLDLQLTCDHPALHDVFANVVQNANLICAKVGGLELEPWLAERFPRRVTDGALRPVRTSANEDAYSVPLSRFQLSEDKIRELLMGRQLYDDPALAIRELYQNALDACRLRQVRIEALKLRGKRPGSWTGEILFRQGKEGDRQYIECEDNGAGMDEDILRKVFANAGERLLYQLEFRDEQADWQVLELQYIPNSQFGVGVFSYFMLADEITVVTRHAPRGGGVAPHGWEVHIANSGSLFQITRTNDLPDGGTRVRLYLTEGEESISVLRTMRQLLWISEHHVEVTEEGSGAVVWEPGRLRYHDEVAESEQHGDDLWWVSGEGGLAADGIRTNEEIYGLIVNLRGERRPQFTVDRKKLREWNRPWVTEQISAALPTLMDWKGFTLPWLWKVAESKPEIGQLIFDYAVEHDHSISLGGIWGQNRKVALSAVGCFPLDRELFKMNHYFYGYASWFTSWRGGLWRAATGALLNARSAPFSATNEGFPQVGPLDAELIEMLDYYRNGALGIDDLLKAIEHPEQKGADRLRRLRRYAVTGVGLARLREIPPVEATCDESDTGLYRVFAAWSPEERPPRRSVAGWVVKTSAMLDRSIGEVLDRAGRLMPPGWKLPELDLGALVNHTCTNTEATLVSAELNGRPPWVEAEISPAHVIAATVALGRSVDEILINCDRLAPLGVQVAARESYPADLTKIETEALGRVRRPGETLHMAALMTVAGRTGSGLVETHRNLSRLERLGLLALPSLDGLTDIEIGPAEIDFIESELAIDILFSREGAYKSSPHIEIVSAIYNRFTAGSKKAVAARRLAPYFTPTEPIIGAEIFWLSYDASRPVGEALKSFAEIYPEAHLPQLPKECLKQDPHYQIAKVFMGNSLWNRKDIKWLDTAAGAVSGAFENNLKLGDFLAKLEPYRALGAPLPELSQDSLDSLNKIEIDEYDYEILTYFDDSGNRAYWESPDRLYRSSVSALELVRAAGRIGLTPAEAHRRMKAFAPLGLTLDYPDVEPPDGPVLWQDLLLLTVHCDGYAPALSGEVDSAHLKMVAAETGESTSWLADRLKLYAPLFSITDVPRGEECPTTK